MAAWLMAMRAHCCEIVDDVDAMDDAMGAKRMRDSVRLRAAAAARRDLGDERADGPSVTWRTSELSSTEEGTDTPRTEIPNRCSRTDHRSLSSPTDAEGLCITVQRIVRAGRDQ